MIFVTVGTQLSFDRLLTAVDRWAAETGTTEEIFAQIGPSEFRSPRMTTVPQLTVPEFKDAVERCRLIIAHAGMGSILSAMTDRKPLIIMPRVASLGEHRNDHQLATAERFKGRPGILVARDASELADQIEASHRLQPGEAIRPFASDQLINTLRFFIQDGTTAPVRHGAYLDPPHRLGSAQRNQKPVEHTPLPG